MFKLQPVFFRDEGTPQGTPATTTTATAPASVPAAVPSAKDFADALTKALDERTSRAEKGVIKSMAAQNGYTEEQAMAILAERRKEDDAKLPEAAQKQIDAANAKLRKYEVSAAIAKEGAALGLLDADVALQLIPADSIKTSDKGELTGIKEALEKLKTDKPYLFGSTTRPTAMAQRVGGHVRRHPGIQQAGQLPNRAAGAEGGQTQLTGRVEVLRRGKV